MYSFIIDIQRIIPKVCLLLFFSFIEFYMESEPGSISISAAAMGEEKSKKMMDDFSDPLLLHHSDHPRLVLVSKVLEGDNYGQWSRAMRLALSAKNKLGFINGDLEKPKSTDTKFPLWE